VVCVIGRSTLKRCHFAVEFARQLPVEGVCLCDMFFVEAVHPLLRYSTHAASNFTENNRSHLQGLASSPAV